MSLIPQNKGLVRPLRLSFLPISALLAFAIGVAPALPIAAAETSEVEACKIAQVDTSQVTRVGWPKFPGIISSEGSPKFLVVGLDFIDAPMTSYGTDRIRSIFQLDKVTDRYKFVSGGKFAPTFDIYPNWVRLPEPSSHYGEDRDLVEFVQGEWGTHHLVHDLIQQIDMKRDLSSYQGILAYVSGGQSLSGKASYATLIDTDLVGENSEITNYIVLGRGWESEERVEKWRPVVHEINHLLGLADLYLYKPNGYWLGRTPGPFGQQAFVFESSSDSLGWNRWLNGWVDSHEIICITDSREINKVFMSPPYDSDASGTQLVIYRISASKVLVIEALAASGYAASTYPNSVLIYQVDSSVNSGEGPVTIIPRPTRLTMAPLSPNLPDWERFKEAPLIPGSYVEYGDFLIVNEAKQKTGSTLSVYIGEAKTKVLDELLGANKGALKTITCKKAKAIKTVSGNKPRCPAGYKKIKSS